MKHTIQTLKKNLTLAEVEALEKELKDKIYPEKSLCTLSTCRICNHVRHDNQLLKEFLGK